MSCDAERLRAWCAARGPVTEALTDPVCVSVLTDRAESRMPAGINGWRFKFSDGTKLFLSSDAAVVQL